jgi:hypothetical protein
MKFAKATRESSPSLEAVSREPLTGSLIRFLSSCGVMKAAVEAEIKAANQ